MATALRSANWGVFKRVHLKLYLDEADADGTATTEATGLFQIPTFASTGVATWGSHTAPGTDLEYCIYGMNISFVTDETSKLVTLELYQGSASGTLMHIFNDCQESGVTAVYFSPYGPLRMGANQKVAAKTTCSGTVDRIDINLFGAIEPVK